MSPPLTFIHFTMAPPHPQPHPSSQTSTPAPRHSRHTRGNPLPSLPSSDSTSSSAQGGTTSNSTPRPPSPPTTPLPDGHLRSWILDDDDSYASADPNSRFVPRTFAVWQLLLRKVRSPAERHLRAAFTPSDEKLHRIPPLFSQPPEVILLRYESSPDYGTTDPNYPGRILLNEAMSMALEEAEEGSSNHTALRFLVFITLSHECRHWVNRQLKPDATPRELSPTGEAGYEFERSLLGGVLKPMTQRSKRNLTDFTISRGFKNVEVITVEEDGSEDGSHESGSGQNIVNRQKIEKAVVKSLLDDTFRRIKGEEKCTLYMARTLEDSFTN